MKEIHEKLALWSTLSKQWQLAQARLASSRSVDRHAQAEMLELKAKTDAAFKDAQDAIRNSAEGSRPQRLRRQPLSKRANPGAHPQ